MLDSWQMKQNQCPKLVSSFVWQFFKFLRGFLWFLDDPFCSGINVFLYGLDVRTYLLWQNNAHIRDIYICIYTYFKFSLWRLVNQLYCLRLVNCTGTISKPNKIVRLKACKLYRYNFQIMTGTISKHVIHSINFDLPEN